MLLVLPFGSLAIAKFNGLSVHCFIVAHFTVLYVYEYLVRILLHVTIYVNVTILRKYSGNGHACASSRYQTVSLPPRDLGTRLDLSMLKSKNQVTLFVKYSCNTSVTFVLPKLCIAKIRLCARFYMGVIYEHTFNR